VKLVEAYLASADHAPGLTAKIFAIAGFVRNQNATAWAGPFDGPVGKAQVGYDRFITPDSSVRPRLAGKRKHASDDGGQAQGALAKAAQEGPAGNLRRQFLGRFAHSVKHD
jgi:hypothetical protein